MLEPIIFGDKIIKRDYDLNNNSLISFDLNKVYDQRKIPADNPDIKKRTLAVLIDGSILDFMRSMGDFEKIGTAYGTSGDTYSTYTLGTGFSLKIFQYINDTYNIYITDYLINVLG